MTDAEREYFVSRLEKMDRARLGWKCKTLAGTPLLALLSVMFLTLWASSFLALREATKREQQAHDDAVPKCVGRRLQIEGDEAGQEALLQAIREQIFAEILKDIEKEEPRP